MNVSRFRLVQGSGPSRNASDSTNVSHFGIFLKFGWVLDRPKVWNIHWIWAILQFGRNFLTKSVNLEPILSLKIGSRLTDFVKKFLLSCKIAQIQWLFHTLAFSSIHSYFKKKPNCETFVESGHFGTSPDPLTMRKRETFIESGHPDAGAERFKRNLLILSQHLDSILRPSNNPYIVLDCETFIKNTPFFIFFKEI